MNNKLTRDYIITPGMCDYTVKLGMADTFSLFMDIASIHAEELGCGTREMSAKNLFWLTVRSRVHFYKRPHMMSHVKASTWPLEPDGVKCIRDYSIETPDGTLLAEGKTEWTVMDLNTGRPVRLEEVYPEGLELLKEEALPEPFVRIPEDFSGCRKLGDYRIRSVDIDLGGHMNNVAYIRAMLGMLSSEEISEMKISDIEVCYRRFCYEGEMLEFFMRDAGENGGSAAAWEIGAVRSDGKTAFISRIS